MKTLLNYLASTTFIKWVRPSFEDDHKTASFRRLSAFSIMVLINYLVIAGKIKTEVDFKVLVTLCLTFLLLTGILTAQHLISAYRGQLSDNQTTNQDEKD